MAKAVKGSAVEKAEKGFIRECKKLHRRVMRRNRDGSEPTTRQVLQRTLKLAEQVRKEMERLKPRAALKAKKRRPKSR